MGRTSTAKDRLIDSAIGLMHDRGYNAVGIMEICNKAGVKKGSFFHFFSSKRDLALTALDSQWQSVEENVLKPAFHKDIPPLERIQRMFLDSYKYQCTNREEYGRMLGCPFGILAAEMSTQDEMLRQKVQFIFDGIARYFEDALIDVLQENPSLRLNPQIVSQTLIAYLEGSLLFAKAHNDTELFKTLADNALLLVLNHSQVH